MEVYIKYGRPGKNDVSHTLGKVRVDAADMLMDRDLTGLRMEGRSQTGPGRDSPQFKFETSSSSDDSLYRERSCLLLTLYCPSTKTK
jgi:hypothetical protein